MGDLLAANYKIREMRDCLTKSETSDLSLFTPETSFKGKNW